MLEGRNEETRLGEEKEKKRKRLREGEEEEEESDLDCSQSAFREVPPSHVRLRKRMMKTDCGT